MPSKNSQKEKLAEIEALANQVAEALGAVIVEVKFGQQGKKRTLTVTIFRTDRAVGHDDCEKFSRQLEASLEALDKQLGSVIEGQYLLEVQSPGIDRTLKSEREYQLFAGQKVEILAKEKIADLGDRFVGILLGLVNEHVKIAHPETLSQNKKKKQAQAQKDLSIEQRKILHIRLYAPDLVPKTR